MAEGPRAHGATPGNTCVVTFRYPDGTRTLRVHGRRTEVNARIMANVQARKRKMTFHDLITNKNVTIDLDEFDTWSVK